MPKAWILEYHKIAPAQTISNGGMWYVEPDTFRRHLEEIKDKGLIVGDLRTVLEGKETVVITFDDAYKNIYTYALPILMEAKINATIFVPTNYVGGINSFDPDLPKEEILSWQELEELRNCGFSIQSHGCSHKGLTSLPDDQVRDEIIRSKATIQDKLGTGVFAFCYPYGLYNSELGHFLQDAGYSMGLRASGGATDSPPVDRFNVNRVLVLNDHTNIQWE